MSVKACLRFFNVFSYDKKKMLVAVLVQNLRKGVFKVCGGESFGKWFAWAAGAIG